MKIAENSLTQSYERIKLIEIKYSIIKGKQQQVNFTALKHADKTQLVSQLTE